MRKLATIRTIKELKPIKGADFIELAIVDGWQCVVKKGEFKVNQKCIYFEIDSFLPIKPEYEFLRKSSFKKMGDKEGFRLRTVKLRKQISQGLIIPLPRKYENYKIGSDLTEELNIEKYEAPISPSLAGTVLGSFPSFIQKTDQERIQNIFDELINDEEIVNLEFESTVKLDGTSMTVYIANCEKYPVKNSKNSDFHLGVCSRNLELKENIDNTQWKIVNETIKEHLIDFHLKTKRNIAIQGELMGPGIQKNRENLTKHIFFCYNIWDIDKQRYLTLNEKKEILKELNIQEVPFIENIKIFLKFKTIEELLQYAEGKSLNAPKREGVVLKANKLINGKFISFKIISNSYLLKNGE